MWNSPNDPACSRTTIHALPMAWSRRPQRIHRQMASSVRALSASLEKVADRQVWDFPLVNIAMAATVEGGKVKGIDLKYCKGCGICAVECPDKVKAIEMKEEASFETNT